MEAQNGGNNLRSGATDDPKTCLARQLQLLEALSRQVRHRVEAGQIHSIMELEGLGAEIWQGVDAQEYVNQERLSWDS